MTAKRTSKKAAEREPIGLIVLLGGLALGWFVMVLAASSRMYFLTTYEVGNMVDPFWEPFAAANVVVLFCLGVISSWLLWLWLNRQAECGSQRKAIIFLAISLVPLVFWVMRAVGVVAWSAQFWEVIWIAAWTGLSFGELARSLAELVPKSAAQQLGSGWLVYLVLTLVSLLVGGWWFSQSVAYHQNFMLGYNDFGHFLQRVINTAEGRGVLMESPVLPMFWDHFNPGLLLVVPLWKIYPSVKLVFVLQAGALAVGSLLIYGISRRIGHSQLAALVFGIAWLVQPSLGQMNLAYTYGWHPITFAIPLLLAAILCLLAKQRVAALGSTLLALAMEESVFVIVAFVAAVCAGLLLFEKWFVKQSGSANDGTNSGGLVGALPSLGWIAIAVTSMLGFVLVYKFSGLAEFQTGRFVALGNSPFEILLSPAIRPGAFWGQVLKLENAVFVTLLWLPCGLPALLRGWRYLLPTLVPLGVLIVWDHTPAHSLAFQYPSTLLPMFWLASLSGAAAGSARGNGDSAVPSAMMALITGLVLSLFVGQLPFSSMTLRDVESMTYGVNGDLRRKSDAEDGRWLTQQVAKLRETGDECLATGRIAAHLVGNRDIETVGQYMERRERLSALPDRQGAPIKHYRWIILDRQEFVKWSASQVEAVEFEARSNGFELVEDRYGVIIFKRPGP